MVGRDRPLVPPCLPVIPNNCGVQQEWFLFFSYSTLICLPRLSHKCLISALGQVLQGHTNQYIYIELMLSGFPVSKTRLSGDG